MDRGDFSEHAKTLSSGAAASTDHSFPGAYALYLAGVVKRWQVTVEDLVDGLGVTPDALSDPRTRITLKQAIGILERARSLTGEPALGYVAGAELPVLAHGMVGMAAISASTLGEATELAIRFCPIVTTALGLRLRVDGREASVVVEEHADFGRARDTVLLLVLVSIWRIGISMAGLDPRKSTACADLAIAPPDYATRRPFGGLPVRFGQPVTRLVFDSARLTVPYKLGDPIALQFARDECNRQLDTLDGANRTVARVRGLINTGGRGVTRIGEVSAALRVSPRTLKRQLAVEGTSFSCLVEEDRRERALIMLRSRELSIKDIAESLGYSNQANFTRAFRRWTGHNPSERRWSG